MLNKNHWNLEDVKFEGRAYCKSDKTVVKGPNYGFVTLPKSLIGKKVKVIIIEEEQNESVSN